jgi:hypothetical protein
MIVVYMKNRPSSSHPRADFIQVVSPLGGGGQAPAPGGPALRGYRMDGTRLVEEPTPPGYLQKYGGWYHPATAWEIEEFRHLGGQL